jgi:hypothetical protein
MQQQLQPKDVGLIKSPEIEMCSPSHAKATTAKRRGLMKSMAIEICSPSHVKATTAKGCGIDESIVSMRMKKNSATVCDMESRMKREDHGINPNVQA